MNISRASLERFEFTADATEFLTLIADISRLNVSFEEHTKPDDDDSTVTHVHYLRVVGSGQLIVSGYNKTSENTDYHFVLHLQGEQFKTKTLYSVPTYNIPQG